MKMILVKKHKMLQLKPYTANVLMNLLRHAFLVVKLVGCNDILLPALSPDFTAPNFFLCGYLKSKVFKENSPIESDKIWKSVGPIQHKMDNILLEMLRNVM